MLNIKKGKLPKGYFDRMGEGESVPIFKSQEDDLLEGFDKSMVVRKSITIHSADLKEQEEGVLITKGCWGGEGTVRNRVVARLDSQKPGEFVLFSDMSKELDYPVLVSRVNSSYKKRKKIIKQVIIEDGGDLYHGMLVCVR